MTTCSPNMIRTTARPAPIALLVRSDVEGYYVASVPALRGCHTQAKSLDTLMKRVQEAIELCKV